MAYSANSIAREFCERSGWTATNLSVQKLVYLTHMLYAGRTGGKPLVVEPFEAWDYGPVVSDLYHRVKAFGSNPIRNVFHSFQRVTDPESVKVIDEVWGVLGDANAGQLVAVTHDPRGAWHSVYRPGQRGIKIPMDAILAEYNARGKAK